MISKDIKGTNSEQILILILLASSWNAQWSKSITEASVDCSGGQAASSSLIQSCQICRMKIEIEHFTEHSLHNVTACYGYLNRLWQLWLYISDVIPAGLCFWHLLDEWSSSLAAFRATRRSWELANGTCCPKSCAMQPNLTTGNNP